jgi:5,5'-dehydrodivanillate O-demethylase
MLDPATNRLLTQTGRGTPMGELLRRYWMPIAAVSDLEKNPIQPVRLMGEDLVLYKDLGGTYGLVERHCPHRRADLAYGFVEECGLRCNYHGWRFGADGACLEQPFEDTAHPEARFREKVRTTAYPVNVKAGLVWAYLGPQPAPLVWNYEPFLWPNGFVQIVFAHVPCNWLQGQENSIDPVHFEWMHRNWSIRLSGQTGPYAPKHLRLAFDEFEWGFQYKRVTADTDEQDLLWTIGRVCLWPNALFTGNHFEWRVPVDDHNTLSVMWHFARVPKEMEPFRQTSIPAWTGPIKDPLTGRWITSHVMNQDFVAWVGQGAISDREHEHLGASDRGVILLRKRFLEDIERVERGDDPKAVIRDPQRNARIDLPIAVRRLVEDGLTRAEMEAHPQAPSFRRYLFQAGQPDEVRRAYDAAMGFDQPPPTSDLMLDVAYRPTTERDVAARARR